MVALRRTLLAPKAFNAVRTRVTQIVRLWRREEHPLPWPEAIHELEHHPIVRPPLFATHSGLP